MAGLQVSLVGLGCNQLGTTCDIEAARPIVHAALDAGVTLFDTADEYGDGRSEEVLGELLAGKRDDAIIATKFGSVIGNDPTRAGASARWIERAVEDSLRRLRTDRIDLYQLHFPDRSVPLEETLTALDRLIKAGKVLKIGACNLDATQIDAAAAAAASAGLTPFMTLQTRLNLLRSEALETIVPACERHGMQLIPFFPLASGLLSGKYRRGAPPLAGSRLADNVPAEIAARILNDATFDRLEALESIAVAEGHTLLELAIAWLAAQPFVGSIICGATKASQVKANVAAAGWQLDSATAKRVLSSTSSSRTGSNAHAH